MSRKIFSRRRTRRSSIRTKIIAVVLVGIATTTLLVTLGSVWREAQRFADAKRAEVEGTAAVLASAVADAVAAGDRFGALKALRSIGRIPSFEYARVERADGGRIAELGIAVTLRENEDLPILLRRSLRVKVPVVKEGKDIGAVTVLVNTSELRNRLIDSLRMGLLAALLSAGLGIIVAFRLQDRITRPLRRLTATMSDIQRTGDFSSLVDNDATDETGVLVEAFNGMMDEIRQRDNRLAKHRETLECTVEERTRDLRTAKDAAEQANAAKSDFLATMSHEIRTPMNGMLVMAELLASAKLDDRHRRYADVVMKSGQSLLTIINDILDFSKIESGKMELECIEFDPATVVDDVLNLFWERAVSKGIDLAGYVAPDVPEIISGDPVRLNQIVSNLVNNALKFTDSGYVKVEVVGACDVLRTGQTALRFRVCDTGIGIPPEKLATVFETFSQADQTTTRKYGGTGLGLAICKRLVEAMNGTIEVSSTLNQGSEFSFTIVTRSPPRAEAERHAPARPLEHAVIMLAGPATCETIASYLADRGIRSEQANAEQMSADRFAAADLILADTPSAVSLAKQRANGTQARNPYVVCLPQLGDSRSDELIESGRVHDLLMRPVSRSAMRNLLDRLEREAPLGRAILQQREGTPLPCYPGASVLVADDSPINREVVFEALKQLGVQADLVADGTEAIAAAATKTYDVIFMDCSMPGLDGFEATRRIRQAEKDALREPVPIIALTAHMAGARADEWQRAGMDDYISKPFRVTDLSRCFGRFFGEGIAAGTPQAGSETGEQESLPVIDHDVLSAVAACGSDGAELSGRVLSLFKEHAPRALLNLAEAAQMRDLGAIADAAHALKSMCRNIGAEKLGAACDRLETDAVAGDLIQLEARLAELPPLLSEILDEIRLLRRGAQKSALQAAATGYVRRN